MTCGPMKVLVWTFLFSAMTSLCEDSKKSSHILGVKEGMYNHVSIIAFLITKITFLLKPYLFAHPNPISAIISWTISWQTITIFLFCMVLPTNSLTNDPTNNRINRIWMSKKIGL